MTNTTRTLIANLKRGDHVFDTFSGITSEVWDVENLGDVIQVYVRPVGSRSRNRRRYIAVYAVNNGIVTETVSVIK